MAKVVTNEDIKSEVELRGYELLTPYDKAKIPIKVKCKNNHVWEVKIGNFRRYDCPFCKGHISQYTYEHVQSYFCERQCTLLTPRNEYENCKSRIKYRCHCGNISETTFDSFKNGKNTGCGKCRIVKSANSRRVKYQFVYEYILEDGNELLSDESENFGSNTIIEILCSCGNVFESTFSRYKSREYQCCPECAIEKAKNKMILSIDEIEQFLNSYGLKLISHAYKDYHFITFECACGRLEETELQALKRRRVKACLKCSDISKRKKLQKYSLEEVKEYFKQNNCTLISTEFYSVDHHLDFICECGKYATTTLYRFKNGARCRQCFLDRNTGESHWNWKGGLTSENAQARNSIEYKHWRDGVFKRDKYTCQCCGNRRGNLRAHHIENFCSNIKKRFDVDNGITLCSECHDPQIKGSFHNTYGTKNNNFQQLEEYIINKRRQLGLAV